MPNHEPYGSFNEDSFFMQEVGVAEKRGFVTPLKRKGQLALTRQHAGYWACTILYIDGQEQTHAPSFTAPTRELAYFEGCKWLVETFGPDSVAEPL